MAAKRGRTITSFGQMFSGLSGGQAVPAVTAIVNLHVSATRIIDFVLGERSTGFKVKARTVDFVLRGRYRDVDT